MKSKKRFAQKHSGFTLIELMIVAAIFAIVLGVATQGLIELQRRSSTDAAKVDKTQEARQFLDQIINDIHQAGFPNSRMYDSTNGGVTPSAAPANPQTTPTIALGLVSLSTTAIQFEGDVDGSGNVSEVVIQLVVPNSGNCPCTLQRGTLLKSQYLSGNQVPYYTEVDNVMNQSIFRAYFNDGSPVTLPAIASDLLNTKTVKVTLNVQSATADTNGVYPVVTMSSEAKINN